MVILIGAESGTGKTLMAQKLLELYRIPYLSVDHLKMGLYRGDKNCGFKPDSSNQVIEARLWPILKGIIETNIENNQNIIIEGCYIFPSRIKEFQEEYQRKIIPVFMGFSQRYIEKYYHAGILRYRNVIETRQEAEYRSMDWFIKENQKWKAMCQDQKAPYFEIDDHYQKEFHKIIAWISAYFEKD